MKSIKEINFQKIKSVGIRVDFNVPIDENFKITDTTRLNRALETIKFIKEKKCKILLISHFGRPKDNFEIKYSFQNLIEQFSKTLNEKINLISFEDFSQIESQEDVIAFNSKYGVELVIDAQQV